MHSQARRGVWGHAPPGKFFQFRPCESASEAVGDHYNMCGNWSVNSGDKSYIVVSQSPFPSESAFVFEALPQNCLFNLGAADLSALCMQDMKQ